MSNDFKLLDLEDVEKQREMNIIQKNNFVQKARSNLNPYEFKILDFMMSKIKKEDTEFHTVYTNFLELMTVLNLPKGGVTYKLLAKDLLALKSKGFYVLTDNGKSITATSWLGYVRIHDNGNVELRLDEFLAPFLLQLAFQEGNFTIYTLSDVIKLKSKYSIMMFKLITSGIFKGMKGNKPVISMEADELAEYFGQPNWPFFKIKERILNAAQKELENKDVYKIKYVYKKSGRKTVGVDIYAVKLQDNEVYKKRLLKEAEKVKAIPKVPLHNWLE